MEKAWDLGENLALSSLAYTRRAEEEHGLVAVGHGGKCTDFGGLTESIRRESLDQRGKWKVR